MGVMGLFCLFRFFWCTCRGHLLAGGQCRLQMRYNRCEQINAPLRAATSNHDLETQFDILEPYIKGRIRWENQYSETKETRASRKASCPCSGWPSQESLAIAYAAGLHEVLNSESLFEALVLTWRYQRRSNLYSDKRKSRQEGLLVCWFVIHLASVWRWCKNMYAWWFAFWSPIVKLWHFFGSATQQGQVEVRTRGWAEVKKASPTCGA